MSIRARGPKIETMDWKRVGAASLNLVYSFLNKFAAKWCKRFPPHLNNISTLTCETWNAHHAGATTALSDKETSEFMPPQRMASKLARFESSGLKRVNRCERCTKHVSLIWSYQRRHWWMAAAINDIIHLGSLTSQSLFQFVQISDAYFEQLLLQ